MLKIFRHGSVILCLTLGVGLDRPVHATKQNEKTTKSDNSAKNKNNKDVDDMTAETQVRGSKSDTELTRVVRRELNKDDRLSTYAKNIKIITLSGSVTLKGPVNSAQERTQVAQIAERLAGVNKVVNQLDVSH